jgi:anti-anti-sigma regulatory factor
MAARGQTTVVVDMSGTQFCDSAGLSVLVRAHKQALAQGGGLRLVLPATGTVPRIFTLTGLDQVIPHFTSLEQALAQVPEGRARPGVHAIVAAHKHATAAGTQLRLVAPGVLRILTLVGVDQLIPIHPTLETALDVA